MDEALISKYPELERTHFWWATRRFLVARIYESLAASAGQSVLDVGCGSGATAAMLADAGARVIGVDSSVDLDVVPGQTEHLMLVSGDYLGLSGRLGRFELVLALDSVEHFPDEEAVMIALASNTASGGHVLVSVPAYEWLWSSHDENNRHYRRYTRRRLREALQRTGLSVERVGYLFAGLLVPKAVLSLAERLLNLTATTGTEVSTFSNILAGRYFAGETRVALRCRNFLPFGTSVVALARRDEPGDHQETAVAEQPNTASIV